MGVGGRDGMGGDSWNGEGSIAGQMGRGMRGNGERGWKG